MTALGLPSGQFAKSIGMKDARWAQYHTENNPRAVTTDALTYIARAGITSDYVLFGDESGLPKRIVDGLRLAEAGLIPVPTELPKSKKSRAVKR